MDKDLINNLINRNPEAVQDIVKQYNKKLFSLVYRFVHDFEEAEDVLQEVWIKFFNSLKNFKGESNFYTYLYRIAVNESLLWLRKSKVKKVFVGLKQEKPYNVTPEMEYIKAEQLEFINQAMEQLPLQQKKVFLLRGQEGLSYKEIGTILKIKENNAKVLFFHALNKIKSILSERKII